MIALGYAANITKLTHEGKVLFYEPHSLSCVKEKVFNIIQDRQLKYEGVGSFSYYNLYVHYLIVQL